MSTRGMIDHLDFGGFGGGVNPQVNYNPYSPDALTQGYTFEPLYQFNSYNCSVVPWLATAYRWVNARTLVYTIRRGVTWSDGRAFGPADVVFTYNLLKRYPALDTTGVWQALARVSSSGNTVIMTFKAPSANMLERVSSVLIVPEHVWGTVRNPVTYTNLGAVGTGPFTPTFFNTQELVLSRNARYWQASKIRIGKLIFHNNQGGGQVDQLNLAQGKYDENGMFVPNIQQVYVSKDPQHNHYWFPPGGEIALGFNLTKAPFNDPKFRQAVAYAIDRQSISTKAEYGYVTNASQTGLILPGQKDWLDPSIKNQGMIPYDASQAAQILAKAGYKKGGNGKLLGKDGKPIEFTFLVQNGWTDWIQAAQIVQQNLQALGMTVNVQTPSPDQVEAQRYVGNFDLTFAVHGGSCSMYDNYHDMFDSRASAPIGQKAISNFIRWEDPKTDALINQLQQTTDVSSQKRAVYGLEKILVDKFPTIPLWYGAHWFEYSTKHAIGWPNERNPYASPTDGLLIITHLRPAQ
jgi:peptide/nickel transport system substrate-binding protein